MIENIRKYTGLMTVVFVLLFIGLLYMGDGTSSKGYGSGAVVVNAHGTGYTEQVFRRRAESPVRLLQELSGASFQARMSLLEYLYEMASASDALPNQSGLDARRFLVNRINLEEGARELGVHASDAEINEFLRETIFVSNTGDFDEETYRTFLQKRLPRLGMGEKEMYQTLGDVLVFQKLQELLGAGLTPSRDFIRARTENNRQQVDFQLVEFKASTFEAKEDPTEEEVQEFWENHKGRYLSEPRRKLTYIVAKPDFAAAVEAKKSADPAPTPAPAPEAQDRTETPQTGESPEGAPAAEAPQPPSTPALDSAVPPTTPPPNPAAELSREEREDIIIDVGAKLDDLWVSIQEAEGARFLELAKEAGYEPISTELVTKADLPAVLRGTIQDHSVTGTRAIFEHHYPGATAMDRISDVLRIGENWIIYRIDDAAEAEELPYEEAKAQARIDLVKERAREAMAAAAEEARGKIIAAVEEGKSFADAAGEAGLTPVRHEKISMTKPVPGDPTPREIFNLVSKVNPGEISEVLTQNDDTRSVFRSLFAHVEKRELVEDESLGNTLEQGYRNQEATLKRLAFSNWLSQKYAASGVSYPGSP